MDTFLQGKHWRMLAMPALGGLVLVLFPKTKVVAHLAGMLAAALLAWYAGHGGARTWWRGGLRWTGCAAGLYLLLGGVWSILPHHLAGTPELVGESFHSLWHVARGMLACALAVLICGDAGGRARVMGWILMAGVMTAANALVDHLLRGYVPGRDRLFGTVGFPTQLAQMMNLCLAASVMAFLEHPIHPVNPANPANPANPIRGGDGARTLALGDGVLLIIAAVMLFWRGDVVLPDATPLVGAGARVALGALAAFVAGGAMLWALARRRGWRGPVAFSAGVFFLITVMTGQRLHILIAMLILFAGAVWHAGARWRVWLLALTAGSVAAACLVVTWSGKLDDVVSFRHRRLIWSGTHELIRLSWPHGIGYGTKVFQQRWSEHRPDPAAYGLSGLPGFDVKETERAYHAHHLWLELLVEQGVAGMIAFHLLWLAVAAACWRRRATPAGWLGVWLALLFLFEGLLHYPLFDRYNLTLQGMLYALAFTDAGGTEVSA